MKVKTAINTIFSDAEISTGSKMEVVAFLRRYSSAARQITHYSCRGQATETLKNMLVLMGMKEGDDFTIATSSYDPEFNQIRWASNLKKITALSTIITNVANRANNLALFDRMYVSLSRKESMESFINEFCDIEAGAVTTSGPVLDERHVAVRILRQTSKIVKSVATLNVNNVNLKNFKFAYSRALEYLDEYFDLSTGKPKSNESPYILPTSILELYARLVLGVSAPNGMPIKSLVFKASRYTYDLFRLLRKDEHLMWNACLNAPLDYLWKLPTVTGSPANPIHGYYFRNAKAVETARLDDKRGVFIGGNAALIHDADAEDNITPALCVSNHRDFWDYVIRIYKSAYGMEAGLTCQCRVGIPSSMKVWERMPDVVVRCAQSGFTPESYWVDKSEESKIPPIAMFGIFLADEISESFSDAYSFLEGSKPYKLVEVDKLNVPDFTLHYLTKEESAWEWFAMTHLDDSAGTVGQYTHTYGRNEPNDTIVRESLAKFRETIKSVSESNNTAYLVEKSSCKDNKSFMPKYEEDGGNNRYTALSAFIEGMCVSMRKAWSRNGSQPLVLKSKSDGSRDSEILITNVYSGIFTDLSPMVGSEKDTGEVFPDPFMPRHKNICDALADTEADKVAFTKFLDRMATGKTMEQVKFAKRSAGTSRTLAMIVETNVDAKKFLSNASLDYLQQAVGTIFLQTMVLNRIDPSCAFDEDSMSRTTTRVKNEYHDVIRTACRPIWEVLFPGSGGSDFRLVSGVYDANRDGVKVTARQDSDGRLSFLFMLTGNIATYAKLAYRLRCGFPFETAYIKTRTFSGFSHEDVAMTKDAWPSMDIANSIIQQHLTKRSIDYDGSTSSRSSQCGEGDAGPLFRLPIMEVPRGRSPTRNWFNSYTSFIDCSGVFAFDHW